MLRKYRIVLAGFILAAIGFVGWAAFLFYGPNNFPDGRDRVFFVSRGETFAAVADSLEAQGMTRNRQEFLVVAKIFGNAHRVHAGKYMIRNGISNAELFLMLREGRGGSLINVVVPEGLTARSQARIFARAIGIDSSKFVRLTRDADFVRSLGVEDSTLEGYLLPDTYGFSWNQDEREVIRKQVEQFKKFFTGSLQSAANEEGWNTHQTLTLASIVEGEAVLNQERPVIAGVYLNRIRRGMKLEADPTIQFILPGGPRRLLYADLRIDHPYNTYIYPGLPPGPVNNPGRLSIMAALFPARHNFIFFVANGKGGHWFSSSYAEHMRYVRQYRRHRARMKSQALEG